MLELRRRAFAKASYGVCVLPGQHLEDEELIALSTIAAALATGILATIAALMISLRGNSQGRVGNR